MLSWTLAEFRGRKLGVILDRGKWLGFVGAPALTLPGRHAAFHDALAELGAEADRIDKLAEDEELRPKP